MDRSCIMFNCLWQLWDWLDPPVLTSSASMEGKKMAPPPQQAGRSHHPSAHQPLQGDPQLQPLYPASAQHRYVQQQHQNSNALVHQPPRPPHPQNMGTRSPLLENHQELYGTRHPTELARQYAIREQQLVNQRLDQQRSMQMGDSSYSIQSPSQDPILTAPVPLGYNASVHQAYLRRNQQQLDHQQIYQNHQSLYQAPAEPRLYQPYTSRIQQPDYSPNGGGHSHTQLLRQQYNELQQMKLQQQMQYQSQAQIHQQQTFAQRQILNQHLHSRQPSQLNIAQYGTSPSTAQLNEVNARLSKRQENNMSPSDAYGTHPPKTNNNNNQSQNNTQSPTSRSSGEPVSSPSTKSPSGSDSRRSSSGTSQALRSPIAQRPLSSPVTKAGWLYKQGSDGLKVWRKRWFVLSEYCLFYYKAQEEDKLLGSVLLPSYQVSVCTGDEKNLRKYSFKCEHANMRTYILAAPDQNSMEEWVRVLTMAAIMQDGSVAPKSLNQSNIVYQQSVYDRQNKPSAQGDQDNTNADSNVTVQHMYENAPPKPRRSNEGYQSPHLDRTERYDPNYDIHRESTYGNSETAQQKTLKNRMNAKSPIHNNPSGVEAIYDSKSNNSNYAQQRHLAKSPEGIYNTHNLSLPLPGTHPNRLENNKSPLTLSNSLPNRVSHNDNRAMHNKSPGYFENKNLSQDNIPKQGYQMDNQNIYGESSYQKMIQQQEMNKRILEREQQYGKEQGAINPAYQQQNLNRNNGVERQSFERRTPETYGRSAIVPGYYNKGRSSDYEDVYAASKNAQAYGESSYTRPMSPVTYGDNTNAAWHQRYLQGNVDQNQVYQQAPTVHLRQKKIPHNYTAPGLPHNAVPRPHSADFLEYESKNTPQNPNSIYTRGANQNTRQQPPRPKSSLDINSYDYNGDSYYYSEARYAEKMRQSAHYLRNKNTSSGILNARSPECLSERKLSMPSFRTNDGTYDSDVRESIYGIQDHNRNIGGTEKYNEITGPNSNWTLKNKSLSLIMNQDDVYNRSNSAMSEGSTVSGYNRDSSQMGSGSGDNFMRSASARLPSVGSDQPFREGEKKVQQREESMKRLLEWKQRMLQSPLTRKPTPATLSLVRSLPPGPSQRQTLPKASTRVNQLQSSYNSYSSDDEERLGDDIAADSAESQPMQEQAGRSPNNPPISPNTPPSHATAQPMGSSQLPKTIFTTMDKHDTHVPDLNTTNHFINTPGKCQNTVNNEQLGDSVDIVTCETDSDSDMQLEYTDKELDEILGQSDNDDSKNDSASGRKSVINFHSLIKDSSFSNSKDGSASHRFHDYEICEIKDDSEANEKNTIESNDNQDRSKTASPIQETPPNGEVGEDHYLPMTPKKTVLSLEPAHTEIIKNINNFGSNLHHEDNPYVEMSQGIGVENAFQNEETQAYEVVCVSNTTVEPVYQELLNLPEKNEKNVLEEKKSSDGNEIKTPSDEGTVGPPPPKSLLKKQISESKLVIRNSSRNDVKSPLPDILMNFQNKSSILSSDADEEGCKDFPIDRAFSRFSLSDNFRPASYYLNSSALPNDMQDSSDSELVSPPPIPTSPPPMEELEASYTPMTGKIAIVNSSSSVKTSTERIILMDHGSTPSMYDTIFKGERIKRNRASLPDVDKKFKDARQALGTKRTSLDTKVVPPTYKTSGNTDSDSLLSYNADRGSSRMSLESDFSSKLDMSISSSTFNTEDRQSINISSEKTSINDDHEFVELRHTHNSSEVERMMKRRPLSEESFMEIESLDSNFHENLDDVNLDQYLDELQASNVYLYTNNMYPALKLSSGEHNTRQLDMAAVGYLNERVAAIREEVQYENLHLMESSMERSRSRNSTFSNTNSDPETVNTFQTVRPLSRMSNLSGISGTSQIHNKSTPNLATRSVSRSSLPIESNFNTSPMNRPSYNHTRHASIEQPTISYYSKTTPYFENEASILKNLNPTFGQDLIANKVNISDMTKKPSKAGTEQPTQETPSRAVTSSHSRDNSLEQSAPYYYSDISSQDNLNISSASTSYSPLFSKNNMNFQTKLNNQRRKGPLGKKCDISHIHNPIHSNLSYQQTADPDEGPLQLAAVARCVSAEFLSAADKCSDIDDKNIYESHAIKSQKISSATSKNIYLSTHDKTTTGEAVNLFGQSYNDCPDERKKSIERILHNVVKSGGEIRCAELSRSRSHSALTDRNPMTITNILTESYTQHTPMSTVKPVNSNLYVETGTFSSSHQRNSDSSDSYARITDEYTFNGEMMWEEDTIWSENLRRVSQRHARSLDHLDCLVSPGGPSGRRSVDLKTMLRSSADGNENIETFQSRNEEALYVNGNVKGQKPIGSKRRPYNKKMSKKIAQPLQPVDQNNENDVYVQLAADAFPDVQIVENDEGVYEQLTTDSLKNTNSEDMDPLNVEKHDGEVRRRFEIDRENIRQWDLMSSGLMRAGEGGGGGDGDGEGEVSDNTNTNSTTASLSASLTGADNLLTKRQPLANSNTNGRSNTIPIRAVSPRVRQPQEQNSWQTSDMDPQWANQNCTNIRNDDNWNCARSPTRPNSSQPIRAVSPRVRRASEADDRPPPPPVPPPPDSPPPPQSLSTSLPDLSAGELLGRTHEELVLILIQLRRRHAVTASAIEQCCTQIHKLQSHINSDEVPDKHQENLKRLEALRNHLADLERHYTKSKPLVHLVDNMVKLGSLFNKSPSTLDRLEQSHVLRDKALQEEMLEQRRWVESTGSLSRDQVQQRVEQLRAMERKVAGEAQELKGLKQEREALHRALGGAHLQHDLSRVHAMLAINTKKLEQTVEGNARLEQELAVLRQKLQQGHNSKQGLVDGEDGANAKTAADATALLEDELKRVQQLVGDLQKQRQELSVAVRQLTDKSQNLGLMAQNGSLQPSNEFINDAHSQSYKKRGSPPWVETDLDEEILEHGSTSPINTMGIKSGGSLYTDNHLDHRVPSPDHSDDQGLSSAFANLSSGEKQEIKTVRIVKRESERRQRDRERSLQPGKDDWSNHHVASTLDQLLEEDALGHYSSSRDTSLSRNDQIPQYNSYNSSNPYQTDNTSTRYSYQKDNTSGSYQPRSHINPPNTLSLTNVNNPFDNYSTSNTTLSNKYVSSPSLTNNNNYTSSHHDNLTLTSGKYSTYQSSAAILPLPVSSSYSSTLSKHSLSQSVPYLEGSTTDVRSTTYSNGVLSPALSKTASITSLTKTNAELSPVFTSEAAKQIIFEMAGEKNGVVKVNGSAHRRQVPKEKRRHNTAPHHLSAKDLDQMNGDDFLYQEKWYRARDDVDMERVLRGSSRSTPRGPPPLAAPPDVVRSTLSAPQTEHYTEQTIDRLLAAPNKIVIPERYIPEQAPELSPEEQQRRQEKVESIKKMLSSTTPSGDPSKSPDESDKRQREHLLQLNQILAKQVMEMSKIVAVKASQSQPLEDDNYDSEDRSPEVELPIYQQRDNFFT